VKEGYGRKGGLCEGSIIRRRMDSGRTVRFAGSSRVLAVALLIS
jgi:hypothetical protein